jgi:hypothetical protein
MLKKKIILAPSFNIFCYEHTKEDMPYQNHIYKTRPGKMTGSQVLWVNPDKKPRRTLI